MKTTNIYILIDPTSNQVRYVGKTNNIAERYKNHKNRCRDVNTHKRNWINKLRKEKLYPLIEVIDVVPQNEWVYWECFWISYYKSLGCNLTNATYGGDGLSHANKTSFKKGSMPWNKGIPCSKDTREKITNALLGTISPKRTPVVMLSIDDEFIKSFDSLTEAATYVSGSIPHISQCCNGKRKTHLGYKWAFKQL